MDAANIVIAAGTAAATSAAFTLAGEAKIIAYPLVDDEYVILQEEFPDDTYRDAVDKEGIGVVLSSRQPSQIIAGYGSYKLYKSVTAGNCAVAVLT